MLKLNLGNIWQVLFPCSNFKTHINVCMTIQGYTPAWIPALSKSCLVMLADRTWSYLCCIKAISESRCLLGLVMEKVAANERITFKLSKFRWHLPLLWKILNTLCSLSRVTYNIYLFKKKQTRKKQKNNWNSGLCKPKIRKTFHTAFNFMFYQLLLALQIR